MARWRWARIGTASGAVLRSAGQEAQGLAREGAAEDVAGRHQCLDPLAVNFREHGAQRRKVAVPSARTATRRSAT